MPQVTLLIFFATNILLDVCIAFMYFAHGATPKAISSIVRIGLSLALFYAVYIGKNWARLLLGILAGLGASGSVMIFLNYSSFLHLFLAVFYAGFCYCLLFNAPIKDFLETR